jgi:CubicO group peptidase (beta-lactamase class C family)
MRREASPTVDGDTVFEIGSITKVFTCLILGTMVERGEAALTDPVAKYLPEGVKVPERGGKQITLQDLATHTSALPREPSNYSYTGDWSQPLPDYSADEMYEFLRDCELTRDIGVQYEYSNIGMALLGHALERCAGADYETLLKTRILDPLGMRDTGISLTPGMKHRLAVGYGQTSSGIQPVPELNRDVFVPAGSLRSTANDMLLFLAATLGHSDTSLARTMASMFQVQHHLRADYTVVPNDGSLRSRLGLRFSSTKTAMGWLVLVPQLYGGFRRDNPIVSHDGGTPGYMSFAGYDPVEQVGVVVLSNAGNTLGVSDIGMHLLNNKLPLLKAPNRKVVVVEVAVLERYVGRYRFPDDNDIWTIRLEGDRLFGSHPGEPEQELLAESQDTFFFTVMIAIVVQVVFITKGEGPASELICRIEGMPDRRAMRILEF